MNEPRMMVMIGTDEIAALRAEILALTKKIDGATIKPRDEWELMADHAARAGVQVQTVRMWIRQGKIDSKRIGAKTYVRG